MVAVIWVVLFLLAVVWFLWFRRTPMYRAHRRTGVVSGQSGVGGVPGQSGVGNAPRWYGDRHVPPLLPELRPDADQATPPVRRWRFGRNRRSSAASALLVERRGRGSVKGFLSERSMRRNAAKQLAGARRLPVAQHPNMRREGVMDDRIRARSVGRYLRRSFSPSEYPRGRVAGRLACAYFAVTVLVIVSAIPEGNGDRAFTVGLAFVATLPLSLGVLSAQDDSAWMLAALAVCALVNAFVFWVGFRGDRV
jgi:hypothetical protein